MYLHGGKKHFKRSECCRCTFNKKQQVNYPADRAGGSLREKDEEEIPTEEYSLYIYQSQASGGSRHDIAVFRNEEGIQVTMGMLGDIILSPSDRAGLDEKCSHGSDAASFVTARRQLIR